MGVATSIIVFAIGAILRFATTVSSASFNIHTVGVILMIVGVVGFLVSLAFWGSWGGFDGFGGGYSRRRTVYQRGVNAATTGSTVVDETHQTVY